MLAHFPPDPFHKEVVHGLIETDGVIEIGVAVDSAWNKSKEQVGELVKQSGAITPKCTTFYKLMDNISSYVKEGWVEGMAKEAVTMLGKNLGEILVEEAVTKVTPDKIEKGNEDSNDLRVDNISEIGVR